MDNSYELVNCWYGRMIMETIHRSRSLGHGLRIEVVNFDNLDSLLDRLHDEMWNLKEEKCPESRVK